MRPDLPQQRRRNAVLICRFLWWLALPFAGGGTLAAYHAATTLSGHVIIHETLGRAEIATVPGMVLDQHFDSRIGSKGRSLTEYYVRYGFRPMIPGAPSAPGAPAADRIISERLVDQATYRRNRPSTPITVRYVAGRPQVSDIAGNESLDWVLYALLAGLAVFLWVLAGLLVWLSAAIQRVTNRPTLPAGGEGDRPQGLPPRP